LGGLEKKEFFLGVANAQWLAAFNQRYETSATKEIFIVTSKVCAVTVALGVHFSDSNRPAIAFDSAARKLVNLDQSAQQKHILQLHQECHQPRARKHARETKRRSAINQRQICPPPYPIKPCSCRGYAKQADQHFEKGRVRDT
jgi:hypothetical protein